MTWVSRPSSPSTIRPDAGTSVRSVWPACAAAGVTASTASRTEFETSNGRFSRTSVPRATRAMSSRSSTSRCTWRTGRSRSRTSTDDEPRSAATSSAITIGASGFRSSCPSIARNRSFARLASASSSFASISSCDDSSNVRSSMRRSSSACRYASFTCATKAVMAAGTSTSPRTLLVAAAGDRQGKQQRRAGQRRRVLAQVPLVQRQRRLAVQLVQHVAGRARHAPERPERIPAAGRPVPDPEAIAVEPDRNDRVRLQPAFGEDDRLAKLGAVGGHAARDDDLRRQHVTEARDDVRSVDAQSVAEHEHADQVVGGERPSDVASRLAARRPVRHRPAGEAEPRVLEANRGDRQRAVLNVGSKDLAGRRAADDRDVRKCHAQRRQAGGIAEHVAGAECESDVRPPGRRGRSLPPAAAKPLDLRRLHGPAGLRIGGVE
jgi:hypothetical protein